MNRRSVVAWSLLALLTVLSGCEAILQFDEGKLDNTSSGGGGQGAGGASTTTSAGGGGTTNPQGGGGSTATGTGGSSTTGTGGSGTGGSTGCTDASQCPDTGSECIAATCLDQTCGTMNLANGAEIADQVTGDCKTAVCDGDGGIGSADDDNDILDDGKDCTLDTCNAGSPESSPAVEGTSCDDDGGKVCDGAGACVECNMDADCMAPTPKCQAHACVPASCNDGVKNGGETDTDCGGPCGATCASGDVCMSAGDCIDGVCNGTCAGAVCNDGVTNGGETDIDCGGGACAKCGPNKGCDVNLDCAGNQCSGAGGVCVPNCSDGVKNNAETGADCGGGTCSGCAVGVSCNQNTDCVGTAFCDVTSLCATKKTNGAACANNAQCSSGSCVDGVCCNVACGGTCLACNLPGSVGACSPIAAGQDPIDECAGAAAVCDGNGGCKKANGQTCGAAMECALNVCTDGVCCNSACSGTCTACNVAGSLGTCTNIPNGTDPANECAGAINCNGNGACGSLLGNGSACGIGTECQSGNCIDGVCCNTTCTGNCQACNLAGTVGACTNIPNNQDPASECSNGACNGSGVCKSDNGQTCANGTSCLSGNCVDGLCCNTTCGALCQACNTAGFLGTCSNVANGQDPANECAGTTSCNGAGACNTLAIGAACTLGTECGSGFCIDSVCCNSACGALCQSCGLAGSVGTCSNIPSGQDPANECASGACGGAGTCKSDNGQTCANGASCLSGNCIDGLCCNAACGGTCQACNISGSNGTCSNIPAGQDPASECVGGTNCNGAGSCQLFGNGVACSINGECASGACVDGVCCNSTCGGACQACNVTGSIGACTNIPNGQDPANECIGATTCNGAGSCVKLPQGSACGANTDCASGFCADGFCCDSACTGTCRTCDGQFSSNGVSGVCDFVLEPTDPYGECTGTAICCFGTCKSPGACLL